MPFQSAFRRVVSALVFDLRFDFAALSSKAGTEIAEALRHCQEAFAACVTEAGGAMALSSRDQLVAVFGAQEVYADHAARAVKAGASAKEKIASLQVLPQVGVGIHCGEMLILQENERPTFSLLGVGFDFAQQLAAIARPGDLLVSDTVIQWFAASPPTGFEVLKGKILDEPDLGNIDWSAAKFEPLPDRLVKHVWLFGPEVRQRHESAVFEFSYLFCVFPPGGEEAIPILQLTEFGTADFDFNTSSPPPTHLQLRIAKYRMLQKLGSGGMGDVWLGIDDFGMQAAVKVMRHGPSINPKMRERFQREARVMAKLQHRNICRIFELGEFDGTIYLAMEFVSGITLNELLFCSLPEPRVHKTIDSLVKALRNAKPTSEAGSPKTNPNARLLPIDQVTALLIRISDGVLFAHEHGVLHRDLKPANILIREDGEPVVSDFGLAKMEFEQEASITVSGEFFGTMDYMAPEQAFSTKTVDERADVYALGGMLYLMLTGQHHFRSSGNLIADANRLQHHEAISPRSLRKEIDRDLEVITLKALSLSPAGRYRTVAAFREDLARYQRGEPILARPLTFLELATKAYARNRKAVWATAAALFAIFLVVVWAFLNVNGQRKQAVAALKQTEESFREAELARTRAEEALKQKDLAVEAANAAEQRAQLAATEAERRRKQAEHALAERKKATADVIRFTKEMENQRKEAELAFAQKVLAENSAAEASSLAKILDSKLAELSAENTKLKATTTFEGASGVASASNSSPEKPFRLTLLHDLGSRMSSQEMGAAGANKLKEALANFENIKTPLQFDGKEFSSSTANSESFIRSATSLRGMTDAWHLALALDPDHLTAAWSLGQAYLAMFLIQEAKVCFAYTRARAMLLGDTELARQADRMLESLESSSTWTESAVLASLKNSERPETNPAENFLPLVRTITASVRVVSYSSMDRMKANRMAFDPRGVSEKHLWLMRVFPDKPNAIFFLDIIRTPEEYHTAKLQRVVLRGREIHDLTPFIPLLHARELDLSDTRFTTFPAAINRVATELRVLKLNRSLAEDVLQFNAASSLQILEIEGVELGSLEPLGKSERLETFRFSPELVTRTSTIEVLRRLSQLRFIGVPGDPTDQTAPLFWVKYDAGAYKNAQLPVAAKGVPPNPQ